MSAVISALGITVSNAEPISIDLPDWGLSAFLLLVLVCYFIAFFRAFKK